MTRTGFGEKRGDFGISAKSKQLGWPCLPMTSNLELSMIPHNTELSIGSLVFEASIKST